MSEQPQNDIAPTEPAPAPTSEERMSAALAKLEGAEPPAPEPKPADPPADPPPTDESKAALWAKITDLDRTKRELEAKLKDTSGAAPAKTLEELIAADPQKAIDLALQHVAGEPDPEPEQPTGADPGLVKLIEDLRGEVTSLKEERAKEVEQSRQREQQAQIAAEVKEIANVIDGTEGGKERWELVSALRGDGGMDLALQTQAEMYKASGQLPTREEALDAAEAYLEKQLTGHWERLSQLNKLRGLFAQKQANDKPSPQSPTPSLSGGGEDTPTPRERTQEDRFQAALAKLETEEAE